MTNAKEETQKTVRDSEEMNSDELDRCSGGFNPQPEPPASDYNDVAQKVNPATRTRRFRGIG